MVIYLGASFYMNPHREWLFKYKRYDRNYVFLWDDSIDTIIGQGKIKLLLKVGRIRTLHMVVDIPELTRNLIFVRKLSDIVVYTMFRTESYQIVWGEIEEEITAIVFLEKKMLSHQRLGHIWESDLCLITLWVLSFVNIVHTKNIMPNITMKCYKSKGNFRVSTQGINKCHDKH